MLSQEIGASRQHLSARGSREPAGSWRSQSRQLLVSEFEPRADAQLARRKELLTGHDARGPCDAEVRIQRAKRAFDEVVVVGDGLRVEDVEDVTNEYESPSPAQGHGIRSVAVDQRREWRAGLEPLGR